MFRSLFDLSPDEAWLPYEPTPREPFDRRAAAHLYRRAGFAASSEQLDAVVRLGPRAAVERLLAAGKNKAGDEEMRRLAQPALLGDDARLLSAWWLYRLQHTAAPLVEKMTLFWHGHFATSAAKVRSARLMLDQNELFRRQALGDFGQLVRAIARDPAMLLYLDSDTNRKNHPNENFAREVMELFCLGVDQYGERDIQELARCFTGWEIQYGAFKFNADQHDEGIKTVLRKSGRFDGDEGLAAVLDQPVAASFLCTKLARFFVTDDELPPEYVAPLARRFRESGLVIAPVVETILSSRLFYSAAARGAKIRSPVELAVDLLRALDASTNLRQLATDLGELGQMLFYPPNVKGWSGGQAWIDTSTLLGRMNLVRRIVENPQTRFGGQTLEAYLGRYNFSSNARIVDHLSELLLAVPLPELLRDEIALRLGGSSVPRPAALNQLIHLLSALPEFQLS
jgi:uncharacterized protein (DUF1800 family)